MLQNERAVYKRKKEMELDNMNKSVCLNCTKKVCRGTYECFKREKKKNANKR